MNDTFWTQHTAQLQIASVPLEIPQPKKGYQWCKRLLIDIGVTWLLILLTAPMMVLIALLIKFTNKGPIFHLRLVQGQYGRPFYAYKFRTMDVNGDEILAHYPLLAQQLRQNYKLRCDPRITPIGKWLRRLSLDELPQLFNIARGQMSLVGPRIITAEEVANYGPLGEKLLTTLPGLTGWWQVNGRSNTSYATRIHLDMYYIDHCNLWLDIHILLRTIWVVIRRQGAY